MNLSSKDASLNSVDEEKQALRERTWGRLEAAGVSPPSEGRIPTFDRQSRAAQRLRSIKAYQEAKTIMAAPDQVLIQARINALADGKDVVLAAPGLRSGFVCLKNKRIRVRDRPEAVKGSMAGKFGLATKTEQLPGIEFMVTGAVAVYARGRRLGKGQGFFDLEYLILLAANKIDPEVAIAALVHDLQIVDEVPADPGDVAVDLIVTPNRVLWAAERPVRPSDINWSRLPHQKVRRMTPLFELRGKKS
ncbi:MAG: 5-formyltetrahydrofolate cyclo-ligase [Proteobacteria bacterium]|nr:5-formyltetrahydrofolate cyclo-ligase [Pseudomonadota bacterium]